MWGRRRNRANPGVVPAWGRSSSNRGLGSGSSLCRTHGKTGLGSDNGGSKSRYGGGSSGDGWSRHGCGGSGGYNSDSGRRAKVGAADRGRRRLHHSRPKAVSSASLHHGWAGEGEEMEKMGGGGFSEMIQNEGGGGGLNRWSRAAEEVKPN